MPTPTSRLPTPLLIAFGLVNLPLSMLMSPTAAVLPNFDLDHSAVTLTGLATATFVARLFDGLTDPAVGYLSDRSGRRKPWMIAGAVIVAASAWFLYNPAPDAGVAHLLVWYLAVTLGWTLVEIPHTAMAAELSRDYHERSRIALWRQLLGFAGGVLFMAAPMLRLRGRTSFTPEVMRAIPTLFGFDARQEITASAALGLKVAFVAWPCLLLVPMLVLAWRYPLGRRAHGILARRLERRLENHA